jgi:uncharacterized protein (DUF2336 family)
MGQKPQPSSATLSPREALDILEERTLAAQSILAARSDAGDDVLCYLAEHGAVATRAAVAANSAAPAMANRKLADDPEEDVRAELAVKLARLMPGLSERESSHIFALTLETLDRLAQDAAVRVRAILAEEIKRLDCIPREVVRRLAQDLEQLVAAPILEYSPLLSDADLVEIIACGQVDACLAAIARRRPLSADVSHRLVQSLDVPAVAALLVNPDAQIRKDTMERILTEAEEISAWHVPLVLRADLSARAVRRIGGFVGASLIEQLAAREDLSDATRTHLNRELRTRLSKPQTHLDDGLRSIQEIVAAAEAEGRLDARFLEQAAQAGQRDVVIHGLAALARVTEGTVRRILGASNAKPIVSLVWYAHLSMRVAFKIQTFIMKLPAHELLPARGGVEFPLSKEEMRWHLNYFNVPA